MEDLQTQTSEEITLSENSGKYCLKCNHCIRLGFSWWYCTVKENSIYPRTCTCSIVRDKRGIDDICKTIEAQQIYEIMSRKKENKERKRWK